MEDIIPLFLPQPDQCIEKTGKVIVALDKLYANIKRFIREQNQDLSNREFVSERTPVPFIIIQEYYSKRHKIDNHSILLSKLYQFTVKSMKKEDKVK